MLKKMTLIAGLFLISQHSFAESCPSVAAIKKNTATGWSLFDSDEGTPLSAERAQDYKKNVDQFAMAEWTNTNNKGAVHCYYRDKEGSTLEAYVGNKNFAPSKATSYWYAVSGSMQCAAGSEKCLLENSIAPQQHQLAMSNKPGTLGRKIQALFRGQPKG